MTTPVERILAGEVPNGVYVVASSPGRQVLEDQLAAADRRLCHVALHGVSDKPGLIDAVRTAIGAPQWTGRNWDAVSDALSDLSWSPARGHVVWLESPGALARSAPDVWAVAVQVLADAATWWSRHHHGFHVLVHDTDPASGLCAL